MTSRLIITFIFEADKKYKAVDLGLQVRLPQLYTKITYNDIAFVYLNYRSWL